MFQQEKKISSDYKLSQRNPPVMFVLGFIGSFGSGFFLSSLHPSHSHTYECDFNSMSLQ